MAKPIIFLIHWLDSSLSLVSKLLEARDFSVHLSRSLEEAEQIYSAFPSAQVKFIFADVTVAHGESWQRFEEEVRQSCNDAVIIRYHPSHAQLLYGLFGHASHSADEEREIAGIGALSMIGNAPHFQEILKLANRYANHDITVLITGETGTGKEVMARYIHSQGSRADMPFVGCNMTAIPETLVESELFGYVRGAFTGADRNKKGLIEGAAGGTLFLDEIGDLAPVIQLKLLRFLETREFYKVGESVPKNSDVRIIAATNKGLEEAINDNGFRKDLYFRLNSARLILPPLRERKEDIVLLIGNFIDQASHQYQT